MDHYLEDGQTIELGSLKISVLHTPGHTAGCCTFLDSPVYAGGAKFCTPEIQFLRTAAVWRQEAGEITLSFLH